MTTPRERVLAVLAGEEPDRVPFIIWDNKIPSPEIEKRLLDLGACFIVKSTVWKVRWEGVEVRREVLPPSANGWPRTRTVYRTASGELDTLHIQLPGTTWEEKHLFGKAADYDALEDLLRARRYVPAFEVFRQADNRHPGHCLARPGTVHSPLHEVIYDIMGIENFCLEWADNRDRLLRLVDLMTADVNARVRLMAESPASLCVIDGNTEISIVGLDLYRRYYLPHIQSACGLLHAAGKFVGAHLDGNNRLIAADVAGTALDVIESFTPPPDGDLPLGDARRQWLEKTLMVNVPSSRHLEGATVVRRLARDLMREGAGDGCRFMVSVCEDLPQRGLETIVPVAEEAAAWRFSA